QSEKLNRDILSTRHLQDRRSAISIEDQIRISQIVHQVDLELFAQSNNALEKCQIHALRRWIRREIQDQHLRSRIHQRDALFQLRQKIVRAMRSEERRV